MHRLLVETELLECEAPVLPKDAAKHLKVLRPESGEEIELFDGCGKCRRYRVGGTLTNGGPAGFGLQASGGVVQAPPPASALTLFACVTKGSRWDWTIEKATELGVTRIVPVISDRTIVRIPKEERAEKRERWMRIAADAARQSDALWLPEVMEAVDFREVLGLVGETDCYIGALTEPPSPLLAQAVLAAKGRSALPRAVFVGPEGDFTPQELAALMAIATPTSFGDTILRAETAAIFAVSVMKAL